MQHQWPSLDARHLYPKRWTHRYWQQVGSGDLLVREADRPRAPTGAGGGGTPPRPLPPFPVTLPARFLFRAEPGGVASAASDRRFFSSLFAEFVAAAATLAARRASRARTWACDDNPSLSEKATHAGRTNAETHGCRNAAIEAASCSWFISTPPHASPSVSSLRGASS